MQRKIFFLSLCCQNGIIFFFYKLFRITILKLFKNYIILHEKNFVSTLYQLCIRYLVKYGTILIVIKTTIFLAEVCTNFFSYQNSIKLNKICNYVIKNLVITTRIVIIPYFTKYFIDTTTHFSVYISHFITYHAVK